MSFTMGVQKMIGLSVTVGSAAFAPAAHSVCMGDPAVGAVVGFDANDPADMAFLFPDSNAFPVVPFVL